MAKRIKLNTDPSPKPRTHVVLDNVSLFGLDDGVPNSIKVGLVVGSVEGSTFVRERLFPKGPIDGAVLYRKDPVAFDRVISAVLEYLVEMGVVDGITE